MTDIFAGRLELTAQERAFIHYVLMEWYMSGRIMPDGVNRRDFINGISNKIGALKLEKMVSPDGTKLSSVEEHEALVKEQV